MPGSVLGQVDQRTVRRVDEHDIRIETEQAGLKHSSADGIGVVRVLHLVVQFGSRVTSSAYRDAFDLCTCARTSQQFLVHHAQEVLTQQTVDLATHEGRIGEHLGGNLARYSDFLGCRGLGRVFPVLERLESTFGHESGTALLVDAVHPCDVRRRGVALEQPVEDHIGLRRGRMDRSVHLRVPQVDCRRGVRRGHERSVFGVQLNAYDLLALHGRDVVLILDESVDLSLEVAFAMTGCALHGRKGFTLRFHGVLQFPEFLAGKAGLLQLGLYIRDNAFVALDARSHCLELRLNVVAEGFQPFHLILGEVAILGQLEIFNFHTFV